MINLPRFQQSSALVDSNGLPTTAFHIWWDTFAGKLEAVLTDQSNQLAAITALQTQQASQLASITTLQADMLTRITEIEAAQAAATAAQSTADIVTRNDSISASATAPTSILTASDAGTNATITVVNHDRKYGDGTIVAVTGSAITALTYSTLYAVYYDDTTRSAGGKTFIATTVLKDAQYNAAPGRHFCGQVTTPASGGGSTSGGPGVPGGGGPYP